jgi:hypothetical protein
MAWRGFWITALATAVGLSGLLYAAVVVIDPYDTLWFSPPFERAPITTNQRFSYPAIARKARFDSVVIGTSTSRLLRPAKLEEALGGRFANLSLNSGTAYEQSRIFGLFARHHPEARTAIFGIDVVWCGTGETYTRFTPRPFPPWLYDEDPWNDLLHLFNLPSMEEAGRQAAFLLGLRAQKYARNGYANFLPAGGKYDLARVRQKIYGEAGPHRKAPVIPPVVPSAAERAAWHFPTHPLLRAMLSALPDTTRKIVVFVPYHQINQPAPGSRRAAVWRECKRRLTEIAEGFANAHVLDFMIPSKITRHDENYWDRLHTTVEVADRVSELIAQGVRTRCGVEGLMRTLSTKTGPNLAEAGLSACARPPAS